VQEVTPKIGITIQLTSDTWQWLDEQARKERTSKRDLIQQALQLLRQQEERKISE